MFFFNSWMMLEKLNLGNRNLMNSHQNLCNNNKNTQVKYYKKIKFYLFSIRRRCKDEETNAAMISKYVTRPCIQQQKCLERNNINLIKENAKVETPKDKKKVTIYVKNTISLIWLFFF